MLDPRKRILYRGIDDIDRVGVLAYLHVHVCARTDAVRR